MHLITSLKFFIQLYTCMAIIYYDFLLKKKALQDLVNAVFF